MNIEHKNRIVIIEPSPVIREGIKSLLEANASEWSVIGAFCDLQVFQKNKPDSTFNIILINPAIISFYSQFNIQELFSDHSDAVIVAIIYGYVDSVTLDSFDGVMDIYDDGKTMMQKLKKIVKDCTGQQKENSATDNVGLSEREKDILVAVAKGMTNKIIADNHNISVHTVISHRKNIARKTGIKTVSGLTVYAIFNGLVSQDELNER
ncbi:MAG: response regulator transcription factor [Tannerellaceae bacterium]|jgi:DNA-binding NarL/FixJ family response regulator|nr:response regulator transcription factor [Tannerellaceae bacterium]